MPSEKCTRVLTLRAPDDFTWVSRDPYRPVWHAIIDSYGFPAWVREYLTSPSPDLSQVGVFIQVGVDELETAGGRRRRKVYGYFSGDFEAYNILSWNPESMPGSWATCVMPAWLLR